VSLWNIFVFLVVLIIGVIVARLVVGSLKKTLIKKEMPEILVEFSSRMLIMVMYIFVIGIALGFLGVEIGGALVSVSVVLGFVLGFALGDTLSNVASGFMVAITQPFKSGDLVTVSGETGIIKSVGISVTEMDTLDNKHIIIPNKSVWGSNIINFTHNARRRVDMIVGVGYGADLDKVLKVTRETLVKDPRVLDDPEPTIAVSEMADSSVNLVVRPWIKTDDYWDVFFDFHKRIKEAYDAAGIEIPFPQRDIHIIDGSVG
jgi:small-conductance mechanosensitive channel